MGPILDQTPIVLPDQPHVIKVKMPKQHPIADVVASIARLTLWAVTGAITFLYAKKQIDEGSSFGHIQAALNILSTLQEK